MDPLPQTPTPLPELPAPHKPFARKFLIWLALVLVVGIGVTLWWWNNSLITVEGSYIDNINGFQRQHDFAVAYVWREGVSDLQEGDTLTVAHRSDDAVLYSTCEYVPHPSIEEFFCEALWPTAIDGYSEKERIVLSKRISFFEFIKGRRSIIEEPIAKINSFESCVAAGYPVMESYPEKCRTSDGLTFTKYEACIQVITSARNPQTREIREFPTPCDVPEGWEKIY